MLIVFSICHSFSKALENLLADSAHALLVIHLRASLQDDYCKKWYVNCKYKHTQECKTYTDSRESMKSQHRAKKRTHCWCSALIPNRFWHSCLLVIDPGVVGLRGRQAKFQRARSRLYRRRICNSRLIWKLLPRSTVYKPTDLRSQIFNYNY